MNHWYLIFIHSPVMILAVGFVFVLIGILFKMEGYKRAAYYNILTGTLFLWCQSAVTFFFMDQTQLSTQQVASWELFRLMNLSVVILYSIISLWLIRRRLAFIYQPPSMIFILLLTLGFSMLIAGEYLILSIL